jgi:hypothetical protein
MLGEFRLIVRGHSITWTVGASIEPSGIAHN